MSKRFLIALIGIVATLIASAVCAEGFTGSKDAKIASYVIGYNTGYYYQSVNSSKDIQIDMVQDGLKDALLKKKPAYTPAEMNQAMIALQKAVQENLAQLSHQIAQNNLKASDEFMAKVAKMKDVHKIQNGLFYKELTPGQGQSPEKTDFVTINYEASLPNGTILYDTFATGYKETYQVDKTMLGWQNALQKMTPGSVWVVYVSPSLAYGEKAPVNVGPNQALVYKIQLISVQKSLR